MGNRLHTVEQTLGADIYEIVDLKVKIITKSQSKQSVIKNQVSMQKIDTIAVDDTGTIKLILWEQLIDSVHTGLPYHFKNHTIRIFDNEKFFHSNELTTVEAIDDITIYMESPEIKDKLLVGQCIAIDINKSTSCIACNKIQPVNNDEEFVTYKNCKTTTLTSVFQTKLVFQMVIKTDQNKFENFTCFDDIIQSFLTIKLCPTPISALNKDEMKKLFLTTGQVTMITSKNTKIISQLLDIVA